MTHRVWHIEKSGIYIQGIYGVFSTKDKAIAAAKRAKTGEKDDYHSFWVIGSELDAEGYGHLEEVPVFKGTHGGNR